MSILGQALIKSAEQRSADTDRLRALGARYAEAYLAARTRFAELSEGGQLAPYQDAVEIGLQKAAAEAPSLLVLEKTGGYVPGQSEPCGASDEEIAVFAASVAEKLAESLEPDELANPSVQEGLVHIAVGLTRHAATDGELPPFLKEKQEKKKEDKEGNEDEGKDDGKDDKE